MSNQLFGLSRTEIIFVRAMTVLVLLLGFAQVECAIIKVGGLLDLILFVEGRYWEYIQSDSICNGNSERGGILNKIYKCR
jgi:hypothetical protein